MRTVVDYCYFFHAKNSKLSVKKLKLETKKKTLWILGSYNCNFSCMIKQSPATLQAPFYPCEPPLAIRLAHSSWSTDIPLSHAFPHPLPILLQAQSHLEE